MPQWRAVSAPAWPAPATEPPCGRAPLRPGSYPRASRPSRFAWYSRRVERYSLHGFSAGAGTWRCPGRYKRSEEHTSELQSLRHLVCRLLLEKKKNKNKYITIDLRCDMNYRSRGNIHTQ